MNTYRIITIAFVLWSSVSALAQTSEIKRTDRLLTASGLPRYSKGENMNTRFVESFRYAGDEEARRWWTDYYKPTIHYSNTEKGRKKRDKINDAYNKKWDEMTQQLPRYYDLFIARPSFSPPYGFSYSNKDTALVYMEQKWNVGKKKDKKITMTTHKMKVDVAVYDSIQCLHKLAVYTSAQFDPDYTTLDGTSYHFIWGTFSGDKYAISSDNGSRTCKRLLKTFNDICLAVRNNDYEGLYAHIPTVHELLAYYRTLLLPDVPIDEWDLDASVRGRNNK